MTAVPIVCEPCAVAGYRTQYDTLSAACTHSCSVTRRIYDAAERHGMTILGADWVAEAEAIFLSLCPSCRRPAARHSSGWLIHCGVAARLVCDDRQGYAIDNLDDPTDERLHAPATITLVGQ